MPSARHMSRSCSASAATRWYMVGTANSIVASSLERRRRALGREPAEVVHAAAAPDRPERAEDQPVDVEQRQAVRDHVLAGPLPRLGERVEVRGDRPPRQHRALRRPGGAGRVDHDRRSVVARLVGNRAALRLEIDVDAAALLDGVGHVGARRAEHELGVRVVEDVRELAGPGLGVDRRHRHAGQQRTDHPDRHLGLTHRPRRHPLLPADLLGHGGRRVAQLPVGERALREPQGDLVARVRQRGEQHARSLIRVAGPANFGH